MIDSKTKISKTSGLKPPLAAALASLEVPIDQELARYRRTRIGVRIQNQSPMGSDIGSQSSDLPDHQATGGKITPTAFILNGTSEANSAPNSPDYFNLISDSESINSHIPPSATNSSSSIVPAVVDGDKNDHSSQPDDYLESSEALLQSLTDAEQSTELPSHPNDNFLSPLGIGSMLLLLVASLTLGYVVLNPNSQGWSPFNVGRWFQTNSSPNSAENIEEVENNTQPRLELKPIPKYPNLAAKEFPEVRKPTDVVGLKPKVQATPSPTITQPPVMTPETELLPLPTIPPVDLPPTSTAEPLSEETTTPPDTNAELKPGADGFYHIVMDNQGDRALSNAQKIVPDAYLSPAQTLIYLAAVKTQAAAEQRVQELQSQGLKARIQQ
ncbi:hypothetical protein [Nodularia sp. UHCC 0506]|uniref:hypothetical protein n=1 Tax=Nodularia sp. UHCC 0506 TaxID=3110243 RepID=UPI002B1F1FD9|nr:hypothetical protein [Nodularia sp. UHCC 0506]MEA5513626.1 hypothetical protein [Nodularia sp. UHCC 0506]